MHSDAYNEQLKEQRVGVCSHNYVLTVNMLFFNLTKLTSKGFLIASYITQVADINILYLLLK